MHLTSNRNQVERVSSFQSLINTPYRGITNAICWQRALIGDFSEIVQKVVLDENMTTLDIDQLAALDLSEQGQLARETLLNDFILLKNHGASPTLNVIKYYERDDAFPFFPTDVYSWHVDRSPIPTDTFLCTYHGASSDILPNDQGIQKIRIPEIREELNKLYDGPDAGFESFLSEYFFDLHYQALPNASPINLGIGNLWKLSTDHPNNQVPPCLHRAPIENLGEHRLMIIC